MAAEGVAIVVAVAMGAQGQERSHGLSVDEASRLAEEDYVYGYPLVTTEMMRHRWPDLSVSE